MQIISKLKDMCIHHQNSPILPTICVVEDKNNGNTSQAMASVRTPPESLEPDDHAVD